MKEPQAASVVEAKSKSDGTPAFRLVIRAEVIPQEPPQPVQGEIDKRKVALTILACIAVLTLSWIGISVVRDGPTSKPVVSEVARSVEPPSTAPVPATSKAADLIRAEPPRQSVAATAEAGSAEAASAESPSTLNEAIPNVPRSALRTIRGTVRVAVQLTVDKHGTVLAASPRHPGPSRYFERLSVEAAKQWTFAPVTTEAQRTVLVQFNFTRNGTTAHASPLRLPLEEASLRIRELPDGDDRSARRAQAVDF